MEVMNVVSFQVVKIDIGFGQHSKNEVLITGLSLVIMKYHHASFDILYITYFQTYLTSQTGFPTSKRDLKKKMFYYLSTLTLTNSLS